MGEAGVEPLHHFLATPHPHGPRHPDHEDPATTGPSGPGGGDRLDGGVESSGCPAARAMTLSPALDPGGEGGEEHRQGALRRRGRAGPARHQKNNRYSSDPRKMS